MRPKFINNRLPTTSGRVCVAALQEAGDNIVRTRGSHVIMAKAGTNPVTVPLHDVVKPGTLRGIIRDAGLSIAEFNNLLRS